MPMQQIQNTNQLPDRDVIEESQQPIHPPQQIQTSHPGNPAQENFQAQLHSNYQSFPGQDSIPINPGYQHITPLQEAQSQQNDPQGFTNQPVHQATDQANTALQYQQHAQLQQSIQQNQTFPTTRQAHVISSTSIPQQTPPQQVTQQAEFSNLQVMIMKTKLYQVGRVLELMAETGDLIPHANSVITPFHSLEIPRYSIIWYFVILSYNSGLQDEQAPAILVLIERLCNTAAQQGSPIIINSYTVHRLILTTVLITSKFYNDIYFANQYIASVGGVSTQNLNQLECFYLEMIDWNLFITPEEFESYSVALASYSPEQKTNQPQSPLPPGTIPVDFIGQQTQGETHTYSSDPGNQNVHSHEMSSQNVYQPLQQQMQPESPQQQLQYQSMEHSSQYSSSSQGQFQASLQTNLGAYTPQSHPHTMSSVPQQNQVQMHPQSQMHFQQSPQFDQSSQGFHQLSALSNQQLQQHAFMQEQQRRMSSEIAHQQQYALLTQQQQQEIQERHRRLSYEYQQQQHYLQQQQLLQYQAQQLQAQLQQQPQLQHGVSIIDPQMYSSQAAFQGHSNPHATSLQQQHGQELNQISQQPMQAQDMNQIQQQYLLLQQQQTQQQFQQSPHGRNYSGPNQN